MIEEKKNLPVGWILAAVSRVGSVRLGRQRSPERQSGQFSTKYLRAANISSDGLDLNDVLEMDFTPEERVIFTLQPGDLVLAEASGSASQVGRSAIWKDEIPGCCFQNTVIRFRPQVSLPEYAHIVFRHYLESNIFSSVARGIGIQHLGGSRFGQMPFPLPPVDEQRRIGAEATQRLTQLSEAERSLRSAVDHIGAQKREILRAGATGELVESEAALAAREGRDFEDASSLLTRIRRSQTAQATLAKVDDAGEIDAILAARQQPLPVGWAWARIGEVGEVRLGRQVSPKNKSGPNLRKYLRVGNVFEDRIDTTDIKEMNFSHKEYEIYRLEVGDVLINEGQSLDLVGRPAMFRGEVPGVCFQNHLIRFRAAQGVHPEYALIVFRHYFHAGHFRKIARGIGIQNLGVSRFAQMPFPLPPVPEQERIVAEARQRLDSSRKQEEAVRASLDRLPLMKRELLAAAVSGTLVPQDQSDEPAAALLERLGMPHDAKPSVPRRQRSIREEESLKIQRLTRSETSPATTLAEVLRSAGRQLRVPELFSMAGYDRDSPADVERFYLALRTEIGRSIRQVGNDAENALLEVIANAPQ